MEKEEKAIVAILILQPILIFDFFLFLTVPHGRVLYAWPAEVQIFKALPNSHII